MALLGFDNEKDKAKKVIENIKSSKTVRLQPTKKTLNDRMKVDKKGSINTYFLFNFSLCRTTGLPGGIYLGVYVLKNTDFNNKRMHPLLFFCV
jgi:hypothetical protein